VGNEQMDRNLPLELYLLRKRKWAKFGSGGGEKTSCSGSTKSGCGKKSIFSRGKNEKEDRESSAE